MTEKTKRTVTGKIYLRFTAPDGEKTRKEFATFFTSDWTGNYGVALQTTTGKEDENGYPERDRIVAVKTESGQKIDVSEALAYFVAFEDMDKRPPREDQ